MIGVGVVVLVGDNPLVGSKQSSWLQDSVHFGIDFGQIPGMAGGFDGVNLIERFGVVRNAMVVSLNAQQQV